MTDGWIIDDFAMIQKEAEKAKAEEDSDDTSKQPDHVWRTGI